MLVVSAPSKFWTLSHTIHGPTAPRWILHHSDPGTNMSGHKNILEMPSDTSLTGSSCTGCHLRVTLSSAVPEDQVSSQQAQGNLGSQDLGSRTADPSGRQCHTIAGGREASSLELGTCSFQSCDITWNWFFKGVSVLQENLKLQEKWGEERWKLNLSHVLHFQCCKSTRSCVHQSSTKAFKRAFENSKKHHRTKNRIWTMKPFSISLGTCPSWAGDPSKETQESFFGNHEALPRLRVTFPFKSSHHY